MILGAQLRRGGDGLGNFLWEGGGYFRPNTGLGIKCKAEIIAIVYLQNSIYNYQYPKDPATKISPVRYDYDLIFTYFEVGGI